MEDKITEAPTSIKNSKFSRRDFLKLATAGTLATTGIGRLAYNILNPSISSPEPLAHDVLQATAVALNRNNEQFSFIPEKGFSREFFERVRKSTFIIEALDPVYNMVQSISGWCVGRGSDFVDIASVRHLVKDVNDPKFNPTQISFWRPYYDNSIIKPRVTKTMTTSIEDSLDLSVTRCFFDSNSLPIVEPLNYVDDFRLHHNDSVLTVGFPREFYDPRSPLMAKTSGDVLTIEDFNPDGSWWAYSRGNAFIGESGEPIVVNNNNNPLVVGVLTSGNRKIARTGITSAQEKEYVAGNNLTIKQLTEQLN